ncbi:MAG: DUF4198 domain-containing protein [Burkholderiaceae bacterium]|nr:DUF4198 domain-containing protein [Burkholderiaceae bacterium]
MKQLVLLFALGLLVNHAGAHGVWTAQQAGGLAVIYGEGLEEEAYDPAQVTNVRAWTPDGAAAGWRAEIRSGRLFIHPAGAARLAFQLDAGEWTQTGGGDWLRGGRGAGVPDAKLTYRLWRFANVLLGAPGDSAIPSGTPLEIQALADPFRLGKGQLLPVRVLLRGEPLAGAKVIADFIHGEQAAPVITDRAGVARVALGGDKLNVLQAAHAEACANGCAVDRNAYSATLSFTLPGPGN